MRMQPVMKNKDKIKHFSAALALTLIFFWLTKNAAIAALAALLFGLIKELIDQIRGKNTIKETLFDTLANILGIGTGVVIYIAITNFLTSYPLNP